LPSTISCLFAVSTVALVAYVSPPNQMERCPPGTEALTLEAASISPLKFTVVAPSVKPSSGIKVAHAAPGTAMIASAVAAMIRVNNLFAID
jgi:hypothetical protein